MYWCSIKNFFNSCHCSLILRCILAFIVKISVELLVWKKFLREKFASFFSFSYLFDVFVDRINILNVCNHFLKHFVLSCTFYFADFNAVLVLFKHKTNETTTKSVNQHVKLSCKKYSTVTRLMSMMTINIRTSFARLHLSIFYFSNIGVSFVLVLILLLYYFKQKIYRATVLTICQRINNIDMILL